MKLVNPVVLGDFGVSDEYGNYDPDNFLCLVLLVNLLKMVVESVKSSGSGDCRKSVESCEPG